MNFQKTRRIGKLRRLGVSVKPENRKVQKVGYNQNMIRDVQDLDVYAKSLKLLENLYEFLRKVPKSEYDSVKQCKKCGKSIPANIAEGFAKRASELEFKRFLMIALGSSDELVTHLRTIAIAVLYLKEESLQLAQDYILLSKRLNKLH